MTRADIDHDWARLAARGSIFRFRTSADRNDGGRLRRWSDHARGFVFGAAAVLALVAAYVFGGGA